MTLLQPFSRAETTLLQPISRSKMTLFQPRHGLAPAERRIKKAKRPSNCPTFRLAPIVHAAMMRRMPAIALAIRAFGHRHQFLCAVCGTGVSLQSMLPERRALLTVRGRFEPLSHGARSHNGPACGQPRRAHAFPHGPARTLNGLPAGGQALRSSHLRSTPTGDESAVRRQKGG